MGYLLSVQTLHEVFVARPRALGPLLPLTTDRSPDVLQAAEARTQVAQAV